MADKIVCPKCRQIQLKIYNAKNSNLITCSKCNYSWISLQQNKLKEDGISVIMDSVNHYNYTIKKSSDPKFDFPFYVLNNQFIKKNPDVQNQPSKAHNTNLNSFYNSNINKNLYTYEPTNFGLYKSPSSKNNIDDYKNTQIKNNKYINPQIKERLLKNQKNFYTDNANISHKIQEDSKILREKILSKYSSLNKSQPTDSQNIDYIPIEKTNNAKLYDNNFQSNDSITAGNNSVKSNITYNETLLQDEKINFLDVPFFSNENNLEQNKVDSFDKYLNKIDQIKNKKTHINKEENNQNTSQVKYNENLSFNESISLTKASNSQDLYDLISSKTDMLDEIPNYTLSEDKTFNIVEDSLLDENNNKEKKEVYTSKFTTRSTHNEEKLKEYQNIKETDFSLSPDSIIDDISLLSIANRYNVNTLSNKIEQGINVVSKNQKSMKHKLNKNQIFEDEIKEELDYHHTNNNSKQIGLDIEDNLNDLTLGVSNIIKAQSIPNPQYANIDNSSFFQHSNISQKYNYIDVLNELKNTFFNFNSGSIIIKFLIYVFLIIIIIFGFNNFTYDNSKHFLGKSEDQIINSIPAIDNEEAVKKEQYYLEHNTKEQNNLNSLFDLESKDSMKKIDDLESKKIITLDKDLFLKQLINPNQNSVDLKNFDKNTHQESFSIKGYMNQKLLDINHFKSNLVNDVKIKDVSGVWINKFSLKSFNVSLKIINTSNYLRGDIGGVEFIFLDYAGNTLATKYVNIMQNIGIKETMVVKMNFSDIPVSTKSVYAKLKK